LRKLIQGCLCPKGFTASQNAYQLWKGRVFELAYLKMQRFKNSALQLFNKS